MKLMSSTIKLVQCQVNIL